MAKQPEPAKAARHEIENRVVPITEPDCDT